MFGFTKLLRVHKGLTFDEFTKPPTRTAQEKKRYNPPGPPGSFCGNKKGKFNPGLFLGVNKHKKSGFSNTRVNTQSKRTSCPDIKEDPIDEDVEEGENPTFLAHEPLILWKVINLASIRI